VAFLKSIAVHGVPFGRGTGGSAVASFAEPTAPAPVWSGARTPGALGVRLVANVRSFGSTGRIAKVGDGARRAAAAKNVTSLLGKFIAPL
jgi:hypothetical protein